jgi:hypothetical protein
MAKDYGQGKGWLSRTLSSISSWYSSNRDWLMPVMELAASAFLADEGDEYIDCDMLNLRLRRIIPYLQQCGLPETQRIAEEMEALFQKTRNLSGLLPISSFSMVPQE